MEALEMAPPPADADTAKAALGPVAELSAGEAWLRHGAGFADAAGDAYMRGAPPADGLATIPEEQAAGVPRSALGMPDANDGAVEPTTVNRLQTQVAAAAAGPDSLLRLLREHGSSEMGGGMALQLPDPPPRELLVLLSDLFDAFALIASRQGAAPPPSHPALPRDLARSQPLCHPHYNPLPPHPHFHHHPLRSPSPSPLTLTTHHSPLTTHHSPLNLHPLQACRRAGDGAARRASVLAAGASGRATTELATRNTRHIRNARPARHVRQRIDGLAEHAQLRAQRCVVHGRAGPEDGSAAALAWQAQVAAVREGLASAHVGGAQLAKARGTVACAGRVDRAGLTAALALGSVVARGDRHTRHDPARGDWFDAGEISSRECE